ncbi:MAG: hypothetical protein ACK2UW_01005 [Anaerolineales bacterium]
MAHNHLEQMIIEWYEYQGYFVKKNIFVGKRALGGFECELDIVAFHPVTKHTVHLEPSLDADSWAERERRFKAKFDAGQKYIKGLFPGLDIPDEIEQIAVLVFASDVHHPYLGGGKLIIADRLIEEIFTELADKKLESNAIPEQWPILRSFQYACQYRQAVLRAWNLS